jgi:uracil-DNA glycosylase family 4
MIVTPSVLPDTEPPRDCPLCPRLVAFRNDLRAQHPDWWNAPVPGWGDREAWLAVVGLAPGKHGANRTGRPFTGDFAGELLFRTLAKFGLSEGEYRADPADGLRLSGAVIVNGVRCLPPENKPTPEEIRTCRPFLAGPLAELRAVRVFVALGQIAHDTAVRTLGLKRYRSDLRTPPETVSGDLQVDLRAQPERGFSIRGAVYIDDIELVEIQPADLVPPMTVRLGTIERAPQPGRFR